MILLKINLNNLICYIWSVFFVVVPIFLVIFFAFTNFQGNFSYENITNTNQFSEVFLKSITTGGISTIICIVLGYPAAIIISEFKQKNQNIIMMLMMVTIWMSFLLRTYAWVTILENNGILNNFLHIFGAKLNIINTNYAVILGMTHNFLPHMILPIHLVVSKIDKKVIEAAEDLGANKFKVFLKIILPLSVPGVISGVTMVFVPAVSTFIISKMLGGGTNVLIGDLIETQFLGNSYNPHLGSAISLILMIIVTLCLGILHQFDSKENEIA